MPTIWNVRFIFQHFLSVVTKQGVLGLQILFFFKCCFLTYIYIFVCSHKESSSNSNQYLTFQSLDVRENYFFYSAMLKKKQNRPLKQKLYNMFCRKHFVHLKEKKRKKIRIPSVSIPLSKVLYNQQQSHKRVGDIRGSINSNFVCHNVTAAKNRA